MKVIYPLSIPNALSFHYTIVIPEDALIDRDALVEGQLPTATRRSVGKNLVASPLVYKRYKQY